jgi:hypothetical protein
MQEEENRSFNQTVNGSMDSEIILFISVLIWTTCPKLLQGFLFKFRPQRREGKLMNNRLLTQMREGRGRESSPSWSSWCPPRTVARRGIPHLLDRTNVDQRRRSDAGGPCNAERLQTIQIFQTAILSVGTLDQPRKPSYPETRHNPLPQRIQKKILMSGH